LPPPKETRRSRKTPEDDREDSTAGKWGSLFGVFGFKGNARSLLSTLESNGCVLFLACSFLFKRHESNTSYTCHVREVRSLIEVGSFKLPYVAPGMFCFFVYSDDVRPNEVIIRGFHMSGCDLGALCNTYSERVGW
jgi:hypothetical protein